MTVIPRGKPDGTQKSSGPMNINEASLDMNRHKFAFINRHMQNPPHKIEYCVQQDVAYTKTRILIIFRNTKLHSRPKTISKAHSHGTIIKKPQQDTMEIENCN
jgi:hypothetical protein